MVEIEERKKILIKEKWRIIDSINLHLINETYRKAAGAHFASNDASRNV